jgi:hypothetical protein
MSAGDIIAFIDDDAIPDKYWLNDILSMYTDKSIGGVGGKVYAPIGTPFMFERGVIDIWGRANPYYTGEDCNDANGTKFNIMLGTNCTFSREALLAVNGFDEYYDYFNDESDLCVRVIKAGYKILHHPHAYIHHEFAKSHVRMDNEGIRLNWFPIAKNTVYFIIKNSQGLASYREQETHLEEEKSRFLEFFKLWQQTGRISEYEANEFTRESEEGFKTGYQSGRNDERLLGNDLDGETGFLQYDPNNIDAVYSICLMCRDDIFQSIGGVAKYTYELAKGYLRAGHIVHVITSGDDEQSWEQNGISIHTVHNEKNKLLQELKTNPVTYECLSYSYCASKKIGQVNAKYGLDIIESALWNYEGVVASSVFRGILPVVVRLQTPLLTVIQTQQWELTEDLKLSMEFESSLMRNAKHVISISESISKTIETLYKISFEEDKINTIYLGIDEIGGIPEKITGRTTEKTNEGTTGNNTENYNILFIGRLERRKGVHTVLEVLPEIMERYPNVNLTFLGNDAFVDSNIGCAFKDYFYKKWGNEKWSSRVTFLGQVDNTVKEKTLSEAGFLVAPSLYESFGLILIEAMSAGKPTIGSRVGGMQEIVVDGETGYLVDPENTDELKSAIVKLIDDPMLCEKMGESAYKRHKEVFSNKAMIDKSLAVYSKLINENV